MGMENFKDHKYLVTCSLFFYLYIIIICLAMWSTETGLAGAGRHEPHFIDPWKEEQSRRQEAIVEVCTAAKDNLTNHPINLRHFTYLPQYNLLYCRIPKTGTTSWLGGTIMRLAEQLGMEFGKTDIEKRIALVEHFKVKDMKMWKRIMKNNPISFANVRHPFERLVSGYLDSVVNWSTKITNKYKGQSSFKDFVTNTVLREADEMELTNRPSKMFTDWRPYHDSCNFCQVRYKVISKTETFDEDKNRILKMIGVDEERRVERMHVHAGDKIHDVTKESFESIPKEVKEKLIKVYQYEFAMFNYDPEMY